MIRSCCDFFKCMLYENDMPSLTRFISLIAFTAFLVCSAYLMLKNQTWQHYDTFAYITGGGGTTAQLFNKFFNSKYNSNQGELPQKNGDVRPTSSQIKTEPNKTSGTTK